MDKEFLSKSPDETISLGRRLAQILQPGDIVCLQGALGAGKTHLVKGLGDAFGIDQKNVQSPTFTLINEYNNGNIPFYHFDCYRMKSPREALEIGVEEYFYGDGVCVIEWPERIASLIPPEAVWIYIEAPDRQTRKFVIGKRGA